MHPTKPGSLAARERLRDHQAVAAQAVAAYSAASVRLDTVISRRARVVADQDALVSASYGELAAAVVAVAHVIGSDIAADVLGLGKAECRRIIKEAK